jgi:hypothetical protein
VIKSSWVLARANTRSLSFDELELPGGLHGVPNVILGFGSLRFACEPGLAIRLAGSAYVPLLLLANRFALRSELGLLALTFRPAHSVMRAEERF